MKNIIRKALRFYLTNTPIKLGRYPLMVALHKYLSSPELVEIRTKDRGKMLVNLEDLMQYPVYYNMFEAKYLKVMDSLLENSDITLDVGGNIGQYALYFATKSKKVYTFEPMPSMIERLKHHIKINHLENKLELVTKALSNENGTMRFSLPSAANSGTATTILGRKANTDEIIEVEAITLDEFIAKNNITGRIDLIKIDIEGAELFALQGMTKLLSGRDNPILILEMNDEMMNLAGYTFEDVLSFLKKFGYKAFEITKKGLLGPHTQISSNSENYCFLADEHLKMEKIRRILK